jgi:hypothetical protein
MTDTRRLVRVTSGALLVLLGALASGAVVLGCNSGSRRARGTTGTGGNQGGGGGFFPVAGPTILSSSPANGEVGVPRDVTPQVRLSSPIRQDSVASGVVLYRSNGTTVPGTAALFGSDTVAFDPDITLDGGTEYILQLTQGLRTTSGVSPGQPLEVRFQTQTSVGAGSVVINEVYAGSADSNGRDDQNPAQDEQFIEIVNVTNQDLSLLGLRLTTNARPQAHVFGSVVLPPGGAIVVWAKAPAGARDVEASGSGLLLDPLGGYRVRLETTTTSPTLIDEVIFPQAGRGARLPDFDESFTRIVDAGVGDLPGERFVRHPDAFGAVSTFSPGGRVNGIPFPPPEDSSSQFSRGTP